MSSTTEQIVDIDYTNWKGERRIRRVRPVSIEFRKSPYHGTSPQWILNAIDCANGQVKDFAMSGIAGWEVFGTDGPRTYEDICAHYESIRVKKSTEQKVLFGQQQTGRSAQEEKR